MRNRFFPTLALTAALFVGARAAAAAAAEAEPHRDAPAAPAAAVPTLSADTGHNAAAAEHGGEAHDDMMSVNYGQAWWTAGIFLVVLFILYPTAWKNILDGLKAREQRIRADIAQAEAARAKADATLKEYNAQLATAEGKVREMLAAATADAERTAATIRARGETEANDAKERATKEIEAASRQAVARVYEQTAELATSVAEKILRRTINVDDQRDLVNRSLQQVESIKNN
jgi:F-type H+-transporting ATPase subunit b